MRITNNKGFSLVELMVVVAIIGILATMSVGAIQKQVAKSRQAEAKTNLSNLYTAEKGFHSEFGTYTSIFQVMKLAYEGDLRYDTGFTLAGANDGNLVAGFGYPSTVPAAPYRSTRQFCVAGRVNGCALMATAAPNPFGATANGSLVTALAEVAPTTVAFRAGAATNSLYKDNGDMWTIDQTKLVRNTMDAIGAD